MRIPGIDTQPDVHPPLPPPRFPLGNNNNMSPHNPVALRRHEVQSSLSSFGSGYGSGYGSVEDSDRFRRKDLRHPTKDDEGYQSWSSEPRYDLVLAL
jgi:hypothetical protein